MPGLYDHLYSHLRDQNQSEKETPFYARISQQLENEPVGITTANLIGLPVKQKKVMLLLMRDSDAVVQGISLQTLQERYPDLDEDIQDTLVSLAHDGWLIVLGQAGRESYRVYLGRKPGSKLGFGIWSALSSRLPQDNP